ncbi:hypothetical protein J2Z35_001149 [Acetoanaerobium pronyense]|uniref:Uncharacterized protein n=1 Tax=Acetoanaerobium pronyense TaxID=1482736 RepID=A0ABS4KHT6_9FIRM|nr:hypothetical protein [Acetoanaerobium pronyense]MBP2027355.1 hypothetical protein [Acetoanaerobium pronyense]
MKTNEIKEMIGKLNTLLKKDDTKGIYDLMSSDFKKRVKLEHFKNLRKYEVSISPDMELIKIYGADKDDFMIRVRYPQNNELRETNILLTNEGNEIKIRKFLENL